jgi:hypothetical protein
MVLKRWLRKGKEAASTPRERQVAGLAQVADERRGSTAPPIIHLTQELREWDVPDEGDEDIWWRGYDLHDENGRGWAWSDPVLSRAGVTITKIAGVQHHSGLLLESVGPGCRLRLVLEPDNPYDPNAVAVWDPEGQTQIGYLPRDVAAVVCRVLSEGHSLEAMCIAELIKRPGDIRAGLRAVVAPPGVVSGWPN